MHLIFVEQGYPRKLFNVENFPIYGTFPMHNYIRPPIIDFLLPVTCPHCNFSGACIIIIAFGDHVIKIFVVVTMLLSICVVVSLGQQLVLWCIIETQDSDISEFSDVVFTT